MSFLEVRNFSFKTGMELKVRGVVKSDPRRFSINFGHSMEVLALHFDPRFNYKGDNRKIVLNSKKDNSWEEEQREDDFPFEAGQKFEVSIVFNFDNFDIYLPNGHMVQFPNRLADKKYKYIFFAGDAKIEEISVTTSEKPTKK